MFLIDQISAKFFKDGVSVIAIYLTNILNLSIKLNTFTSKYKIAKIIPLFNSLPPYDPLCWSYIQPSFKQQYLENNESKYIIYRVFNKLYNHKQVNRLGTCFSVVIDV